MYLCTGIWLIYLLHMLLYMCGWYKCYVLLYLSSLFINIYDIRKYSYIQVGYACHILCVWLVHIIFLLNNPVVTR